MLPPFLTCPSIQKGSTFLHLGHTSKHYRGLSASRSFQLLLILLTIAYLLTTRTRCRRSQWQRGHGQDYADTFGKLWRLLTDFKGTIRWKNVLGCVYKPNSNNLKIWKTLSLKKNLHVPVVNNYADTRFSNFAIE